jgi:group I intron endonuclease
MIMIGIYKILNIINNKVYIGSAIDMKKRWRDHKWHLNHNKHHNSHLQSSWNKYGANLFKFSILLECLVDELLIKEKELILEYNSFDNKYGYNVNDPEHMFLNRKHTEETKKILSEQKLGSKNPMFGMCGNKHPNFNKKFSIKSRNKMSKSHLGIPTNRQSNVKLTKEDVINIHNKYFNEKISQPKLAIQYNVSYAAINKIIMKKTWSHIFNHEKH